MSQALLALCMIVKDEERMLPDCLASVDDLIDELIIVDTGSTDGTREICDAYGAFVVDLPWEGDFSKARNAGLEYATAKWILQLDADEVLVQEDTAFLRRILNEGTEDCYFLQVFDVAFGLLNPLIRLWRNEPAFRFKGRIHETVEFNNALAPGRVLNAANSGVRILHRGYATGDEDNTRKGHRNLNILMEEIRRDPSDAAMLFYAGNEFSRLGDREEALKYWFGALDRDTEVKMPFIPFQLARVLLDMGEVEEALEVVEAGMKRSPDFRDLFFLRARILMMMGDRENALSDLAAVADSAPPDYPYPQEAAMGRTVALYLMRQILHDSGRFSEADEIQKELDQEAPRDAGLLFYLGKQFLGSMSPDEAREHFLELADMRLPAVRGVHETLFGRAR